MELKPHLPNLPQGVEGTSANHTIPPDVPIRTSPLDIINRLLVYPPGDRLTAADVLNHPWFKGGEALLLPARITTRRFSPTVMNEWNGQTLGFWLGAFFGTGRDG